MDVVVEDDQLALAIGRRGQNVRLAAMLTGYNINIISKAKLEKTARAAENLIQLEELQIHTRCDEVGVMNVGDFDSLSAEDVAQTLSIEKAMLAY